jgi:hypothetical protein
MRREVGNHFVPKYNLGTSAALLHACVPKYNLGTRVNN